MNLPIRLIGVVVLLSIAVRTENAIDEDTASEALNSFGLKLLAETSRQLSEDTNIAISPYTVWTAMSIVNEGARGNTARELERTLSIPPNGTERQAFKQLQQRLLQSVKQRDEGVTLDALNSVFTRIEATLNTQYVNLIGEIYGVKVEPLDFNQPEVAAKHINQVVSNVTKGRIPKVVDADNVKDSYMFITSALFFKGLWDKKFDKAFTKQLPFYNEQKERIGTVDMMHTNGAFPFASILHGKANAIELPYVGGKLSMILVLPTGNDPLNDILRSIAQSPVSLILDHLTKSKEMFADSEVKVHLPRFKITTELPLNSVLMVMGIGDVFDASKADLSGASQDGLFVSRVFHKTEIQVDEEGTTGSSATTAESTNKSGMTEFRANKPFAFFVIDKETQAIIFMGKVYNPNV